ncbi:MAG: D-alanine--D-alanine ligase [Planctomycetota bacterium]
MKVMVLAGGPDREREVSLRSGAQVAAALREAGHAVRERDLMPDDQTALGGFAAWGGEVVFPVFHGKWGEGGGAQRLLETAGVKYVGCREAAARLCTDKAATKRRLLDAKLPTPAFELVNSESQPTLPTPVVIKPNDDGSSIDLAICPDPEAVKKAWAELSPRNPVLLVERFITGKEMTVGIVEDESGEPVALPTIQIVPATAFYDYDAKYVRDDTRYLFDAVPEAVETSLRGLAVRVFRELGCRQLSRVDLFLDDADQPWVIEVNTMPGFTSHSLLPMAAARSGLPLPRLVDRLVTRAARDWIG